MFLIDVTYKKGLSEVDAFLTAHRAHLAKAYEAGLLIVSGRKNPRTGGLMLLRMKSREEVNAFIAADPFFTRGVANYAVTEWVPTGWDSGFAGYVDT
jgi:uncharacterized protein YciI